jgi:hypothetical protein
MKSTTRSLPTSPANVMFALIVLSDDTIGIGTLMFPVPDKAIDWATIVPSSADLVIRYRTVELIDGFLISTVTARLSVLLVYFNNMITILFELVLYVAVKFGVVPATVAVLLVQVDAILKSSLLL